jgi:hypothetical protein
VSRIAFRSGAIISSKISAGRARGRASGSGFGFSIVAFLLPPNFLASRSSVGAVVARSAA